MRFPARIVLTSVLIVCGGSAWAESTVPSGTLQVPSGAAHDQRAHDQPVKPATAVPRLPVRKEGSSATSKTPVVPPHGRLHPHKPVTGKTAGAAKVVPAQPEPPAGMPVVPPPDTATPTEKLADPERPEGAPAKLPRFASLRSDDVNMRAGPGTRYRIDWVYKRRDLPVEIEREFDVWRWVRDADGMQGWVHQATLIGRRSFIVQIADATLRSEASDTASAVAVLKLGVIGRIRSCEGSSGWCNVQTGSYRGYLRRDQFWGVFPGEVVAP